MFRVRPRRVLVAHSDPAAMELISTHLALAGYDVSSARTGREAISIMHNTQPQVCILNLGLEAMDGYQVMNWMKRSGTFGRTAVMVMTDRHCQAEFNESQELGAADYMSRPFDDADFLARIKRLLSVGAKSDRAHPVNGVLI